MKNKNQKRERDINNKKKPQEKKKNHVILDVLVLFRQCPNVLLNSNSGNWKSPISNSNTINLYQGLDTISDCSN